MTDEAKHEETFETQLRRLLNTWSREASSNTPDFVLCQFMARSLEAFDGAVNARDRWYGFKPFDANAPTNEPHPLVPPCGGLRCWRADDGTWRHSSKSYSTCSENKP